VLSAWYRDAYAATRFKFTEQTFLLIDMPSLLVRSVQIMNKKGEMQEAWYLHHTDVA